MKITATLLLASFLAGCNQTAPAPPSFQAPPAQAVAAAPLAGVGYVKAAEFSRASLWPPSRNNWMAPGAVKSTAAQFGPGLDVGALRIGESGYWEILGTQGPSWVFFNPKNAAHYFYASGYQRYGPGWSYGPGHNQHSEVINYFAEVYGRQPTQMEQLDIEHNRTLYENLLRTYQEKIGFRPPGPTPTPVPPTPTPPPPTPTPTPPPAPAFSGILVITENGIERRFKLVELH